MDDDIDLARRFGAIERLHGPGSLDRVAAAHVCVVGIGGVGSWAVESLARAGVGKLTLVDLDHIAESNVNRQIHALEATLGAAKVQAMAARVAQINPRCVTTCIEEFVTDDNVATLLPACDALIDAIDNVRAKAALIAWARRAGIAIVTTGGAGGRSDPTRVTVDDLSRTVQDALASKVRARLRKHHGFARDPKKKFGVECVFSTEPIRRPDAHRRIATAEVPDGPACAPVDGAAGLACAGYGSLAAVTAVFGFAASARVLAHLLARLPRKERP